ncbi:MULTISPECIES: YggS family pyridoxal phosphate-dependent enzyme [Idiomarina]|uniref:YggS family pyridoxal phosphate-dependent enzyme n=1 Tax=Idiomarina TaxID=135575 RepID=UPI001389F49E|nr:MULTISPECIES: YggS family pyridoxal phosphate-dependent enzyme [Idiomarina]MRJ43053.1 YggS family pyridoxal phosphate-dependent enzyme [Idiomarina sp. FeN1]NCU58235.1 YggS family pyridoxal phosphate-dependent enzyme [Idiomarina sp. FenA--70]NCU60933.1 YggS family pyridoxal phosphate-dependent enzyme [Idiomarina sp. FenBw--71]UUN14949.1 YggS family pyridoxal phosphate-dependent enzyme [Idiomarina loihiensis]
MNNIAERIKEVRNQIKQATQAAQRQPHSVQLLAVSKTKPAADVAAAHAAGQVDFGENYVQEGVQKITQLQHLPLTWHFIGPIQSNKTKDIAEHFAWVHSLDREKIARRLSQQRPAHLPPLQVLIQINIDDESSKAGIAPAQLEQMAQLIASLPQLQLRGLMTIPQADASADQQAHSFAAMQRLFLQLQTQYDQIDTLSMGMSNDLAAAIAHGSTMVRIGTAIFGARTNSIK